MRSQALALALFGAALLTGGESLAQTTPAVNPLDAVPDKMPFDVPYGAPIALERAQAVVAAAVAEAAKHEGKMKFALVDSGGQLVALAPLDRAHLSSVADF